jgi:Na+-transporting methylmalonyl-CoA/oxaloacetate decarboxylase gamma subunit
LRHQAVEEKDHRSVRGSIFFEESGGSTKILLIVQTKSGCIRSREKGAFQMLEQALSLMGIGMGTVGAFLTLMVFVMYGTAAILKDRFQDPTPKDKAKPRQDDNVKIAVAIAAAKRMQG